MKIAFRIIGLLQLACIILLITSPIVWIWGSWDFFWRYILTIFILMWACYIIYEGGKKALRGDEEKPKTKTFAERMSEKQS